MSHPLASRKLLVAVPILSSVFNQQMLVWHEAFVGVAEEESLVFFGEGFE